MTTTPIPVTPEVTIFDECGTADDTWEGVPMEGIESYRQFADVTDATVVLAIPGPGYVLAIPEGSPWQYDPHANSASLVIEFTDVPCETGVVIPEEPITVLPATGADPFLPVVIGIALLIAGITAGVGARIRGLRR